MATSSAMSEKWHARDVASAASDFYWKSVGRRNAEEGKGKSGKGKREERNREKGRAEKGRREGGCGHRAREGWGHVRPHTALSLAKITDAE